MSGRKKINGCGKKGKQEQIKNNKIEGKNIERNREIRMGHRKIDNKTKKANKRRVSEEIK
jgi:hypothetical protein